MKLKNKVAMMIVIIVLLASMQVFAGQQTYQEGMNYFREGNFSNAFSKFIDTIAKESEFVEARYMAGLSAYRLNRYSTAQSHLEQAHKLDEKHYGIMINLGRSYLAQDLNEKAIDIAEKAIESKSGLADGYSILARAQMRKNLLAEAVDNYNKSLEINSDNYHTLNNLGYVYLQKGEYQQAVDTLEKAAAFEPEISYIYNNLGIAYENLGQLKEAKQAYETALEINQDYQKAENNLKRVINKLDN